MLWDCYFINSDELEWILNGMAWALFVYLFVYKSSYFFLLLTISVQRCGEAIGVQELYFWHLEDTGFW